MAPCPVFLSMWVPVLFVYVVEGVNCVTLHVYVLLAVSTDLWCSRELALVRSSYPECTTPEEVMRLWGAGTGDLLREHGKEHQT